MTSDDIIYQEIGKNYRFYLGWRHAAVAGYLIVLGGSISVTVSGWGNAAKIVWAIPLGTALVGVFFWVFDRRVRDLYHAAIRSGRDFEVDGRGPYNRLNNEVTIHHSASRIFELSHSRALDILYWGSAGLLIFISIFLYFL